VGKEDDVIVRTLKERLGPGKFKTVYVYQCTSCKEETKIVKSWTGAGPRGGFRCNCGKVISF
jgi:hypothetical protein